MRNNAYLNLLWIMPFLTGYHGNQQKVGNALTRFLQQPPVAFRCWFGTLSPAGLSQAARGPRAGSQQTTFDG